MNVSLYRSLNCGTSRHIRAMIINRPLVVTPVDILLRRPSEWVLGILRTLRNDTFTHEVSERDVDANANGRRLF